MFKCYTLRTIKRQNSWICSRIYISEVLKHHSVLLLQACCLYSIDSQCCMAKIVACPSHAALTGYSADEVEMLSLKL